MKLILPLLAALLCWTTVYSQDADVISDNQIYSDVLREFIPQVSRGNKYRKVIYRTKPIKKNIDVKLMEEAIDKKDMSKLAMISTNLITMANNNIYIDTELVNLIRQFEKDTLPDQINYDKIKIPFKTFTFTEAQMQDLFSRGTKEGWNDFYEEYPRAFGILEMSGITRSADGESCMLYVGYQRYGLEGAGYLLWIDMRGEISIKGKIKLWES
ncbi:MAG: hypothetical protein AAFY71_12780 [Bacteroidota bacterium]